MLSQRSHPDYIAASKRRSQNCGGCLLIFSLILLVYYGSYFFLRDPLPQNPQLIAHRGGPTNAPENTMAAFRHAIELGVDWIELDVQQTADGALVVIHDETVNRTTDGTGSVADLTLEYIRSLDAGDGQQVPTFDEVIMLASDAGVGLLPEMKSPQLYPNIEKQIVEAITDRAYAGRTIVQSFDKQKLSRMLIIDPTMRVCPLYGLWDLNLGAPQPHKALVLCPMAEMVILNPWMILQTHHAGREVYPWFGVIEHPITMRLLLAFGVDGLMVDDTLALAKILSP